MNGERSGEAREPEKLPLDARLLSEAIIEFNISRRSVGLYPPGHAVIREAIRRAHEILGRLFDIRSAITLGIAKDALMIDEYELERKNPVYRDFALCFHEKGVAGISFHVGLEREELVALLEMLTARDLPAGGEFAEMAEARGIVHIKLMPVDFSGFQFVEGGRRATDSRAEAVWDDYVHGLLEGTLSLEGDASPPMIEAPPERVADIINQEAVGGAGSEAYDRVITAYLRKRDDSRLSPESLNKLFTLIENLNPAVKRQFLTMAAGRLSTDLRAAENTLREMSSEGFARIVNIFTKQGSLVPETLKNVLQRLGASRMPGDYGFHPSWEAGTVVHDIELGDALSELFDEDHFHRYVSAEYKKVLDAMLGGPAAAAELNDLVLQCSNEVVDRVSSEVMLKALHADILDAGGFQRILERLAEFSREFAETGRFGEVLAIYNAMNDHAMGGRFREEALGMIEHFFHSEAFMVALVDAAGTWGRRNREGFVSLAAALKGPIVPRLIDILIEERQAGVRKYLLSVLEAIGRDIMAEVIRRLGDPKWYVVRNMICLVRQCGDESHVPHVRRLAKHHDSRVRLEVIRTLLHFRTRDSVPLLKLFLKTEDEGLRVKAVELCGAYRLGETVPLLLEILERKDALGADLPGKVPVVKALGGIGDGRAVKSLMKIAGSRVIFRKGHLDELKLEIFRNLRNYPPESVRPLLELGRTMDSEEIRVVCEQMMKAHFPGQQEPL